MAPDEIHLASPGTMVMPDPDSEERIVVPMPDFAALKESVGSMRHPVASASSWVTAFLGIAIGAAVTWLAMPHHTTSANTVLVVIGGAIVLALFMAWVGKEQRDKDRSDKTRIVGTMDRLEKTCPRIRPNSTSHGGAVQ